MTRMLRPLLLASLALWPATASATSRIKDIVEVENVRENQLVGYGLVVGLAGTGDNPRNAPFTTQAVASMLERMGVTVRPNDMKPANIAAVMVTANLPAYARKGGRVDVQVAALGDATSLQGGTLIATPLLGLDGEAYAVAQGSVQVSGFSARGAAATVSRGSTTSARVPGGAIVEREVGFGFAGQDQVKLALRNPDFTTAQRVAQAINAALGTPAATPLDPGTVELRTPQGWQGGIVSLVTRIERLPVDVDQTARIVIDEASGTVVMGADVRISKVAIAQGNLTISVAEAPQVSQPNGLSKTGETAIVPRTAISVEDGSGKSMAVIDGGASLRDLVAGLNALGVSPRDLITILQSLRAAGALQAEIEVF
ncbi:MAG: flagellar basal body P-ring protein FlgI [Alphaproteobacteria bacterium]|nr:flagellar basal body P-ring protein FlgI [Alphaproteobacteria bacterium]